MAALAATVAASLAFTLATESPCAQHSFTTCAFSSALNLRRFKPLSAAIVSTGWHVDTIVNSLNGACKMGWLDVHGRRRFATLSIEDG